MILGTGCGCNGNRIQRLVRRVIVDRRTDLTVLEIEPVDSILHRRTRLVQVSAPGGLRRPDDQQTIVLSGIGIAITSALAVGTVLVDVGREYFQRLRIVGVTGSDHAQLTAAVAVVERAVDKHNSPIRHFTLLPAKAATLIAPEINEPGTIGIHRKEGGCTRRVITHAMVLPALEQQPPVAHDDEFRIGADIEADLLDI